MAWNRPRRRVVPDARPSQAPAAPKVPDYSTGIPDDVLAQAERLGQHALDIVNGLAQAGDSIAARAVPSLLGCIARIKGARAGLSAAPREMPDPMGLAGTLD